MNPEVNWFFNKKTQWQQSYEVLRDLVLAADLTETLKWGCPCYTLDSNNVVLIHGFKHYCALFFMKGAILPDPNNILIQQTEYVQAGRQLRFANLAEIIAQTAVIEAYIQNAIAVEKSGAKVELKKATEFAIPVEFEIALAEMPDLNAAFYRLTPGRQRGYLLYFGAAKQAKTRLDRIEKSIPQILEGKGRDDDWK